MTSSDYNIHFVKELYVPINKLMLRCFLVIAMIVFVKELNAPIKKLILKWFIVITIFVVVEKKCVPINKLDMSRISNINTITSYLKQYPKVNK